MITLVTGGARSGKSTFAEEICRDSNQVIYIACAKVTDEEMQDRVDKHKAQRPSTWYTLEAYKNLDPLLFNLDKFSKAQYILLDCITTMITNHMMDFDLDYDTCTMDEIEMVETSIVTEINNLLNLFKDSNKHLVIVTNEVGLGLVPAFRMGRIFRDIAGRCNKLIASNADSVYMLVSGIDIKIK